MNLETVAIDSLTPDPRNARNHDEGVPELAESLVEFGQRKNLVVWHDVVISGNGLMLAAQSLGWTEVEIDRVPDEWSYEKAQAYALADNRVAELSTWDIPVLRAIEYDLEAAGWDLERFGFEQLAPPTMTGDRDEAPPLPEKAIAKPGYMYQLGQHLVLCADSTTTEAYQKLLGDEHADIIWTDPPYNVDYEGAAGTMTGDAMSEKDFLIFLAAAFKNMHARIKPGGAIYVAHPDSSGGIFRAAFTKSGFMLKQCLIWVKDQFVLGRQDYHWQHEPILYGWKPGAAHKWTGPRTYSTVLDTETPLSKYTKADLLAIVKDIRDGSTVIREFRPRRSALHPTMKPVGLVTRMLANNTERGDVVLDPFGGSGSTLIAAEELGLRARLIEIDPRYVDVIVNRWQDLTGQRAKLLKKS